MKNNHNTIKKVLIDYSSFSGILRLKINDSVYKKVASFVSDELNSEIDNQIWINKLGNVEENLTLQYVIHNDKRS